MRNLRKPVKNYYETIGVSPNASHEDIKIAFRRLARRYHPDVNPGDNSAEEKFKEINEAYDVLSDDRKRQQYDLQFLGTSRRQKIYPNSNGKRDFDFSPLSSFKDFVGDLNQRNSTASQQTTTIPRSRPNNTEAYRPGTTKKVKLVEPRPLARDIEAKLTLPLEKAYQGGRERIRLEDGRSLEVDMPPAMYGGQKIRLRGQGIKGGDLYLKISIAPHRVFTLEGADISCRIPLTPSEAILGGSLEVPTIDGLVKMNVPAGVKSGQRLRLANKGYPNLRGERGDQLVIVEVVTPNQNQISPEERELYAKIRQIETFNPRQSIIN